MIVGVGVGLAADAVAVAVGVGLGVGFGDGVDHSMSSSSDIPESIRVDDRVDDRADVPTLDFVLTDDAADVDEVVDVKLLTVAVAVGAGGGLFL